VDAAETAAAEARAGAAATAAAADAEVSIGGASAPDIDAAVDTAVATRPLQAVPSAGAAEASAPGDAARDTAGADRSAAASAPPAALRADRADQSALDGIDLDVFADAVAQKILHRLTDARIDAIVSERVLEIAERLVREEIERIKADAQ
jgi:outer membrane scaffolding protein for murein synthesis (MipA/OmpV family)